MFDFERDSLCLEIVSSTLLRRFMQVEVIHSVQGCWNCYRTLRLMWCVMSNDRRSVRVKSIWNKKKLIHKFNGSTTTWKKPATLNLKLARGCATKSLVLCCSAPDHQAEILSCAYFTYPFIFFPSLVLFMRIVAKANEEKKRWLNLCGYRPFKIKFNMHRNGSVCECVRYVNFDKTVSFDDTHKEGEGEGEGEGERSVETKNATYVNIYPKKSLIHTNIHIWRGADTINTQESNVQTAIV